MDDQNQKLSVPLLVTAIEALPPSSAVRPAGVSVAVYSVLTAVAPLSVPSTGPVTAGRFDQFSVDSTQPSAATDTVCTSTVPANDSLVVVRRSVAPVSVVPDGAAGRAKRRYEE